MATLHVDLQEGFEKATVAIRLNGREVYRGEDLSTMLLYGLAASTEFEVEYGTLEVEIAVEDLRLMLPLEIAGDLYLGVSLEEGEVRHIVSDTPFGYS